MEVDTLFQRLQPHKGSSETPPPAIDCASDGPLQPHKGSSETRFLFLAEDVTAHFNPTRVRLKRHRDDVASPDRRLQPHKGSSETMPDFGHTPA